MLKQIAAAIVLLCQTVIADAEPYTPSPDEAVAEWSAAQMKQLRGPNPNEAQIQDPQTIVESANTYLAEAGQPGQALLYGLAKATLKPLIEQATERPDAWLAWARVQQHQHAFDDAQAALKRVLRIDSRNTAANLMAARIHLVQGNPDAAQQICLRLLGHADLLTTSACSLEAAGYQGKLESSYEQLSAMVNRHGIPDDERGPWLTQMLGDMALRLGTPTAALAWLDPQLKGADVSYLAQWADAQLSAANYRAVLDHLSTVVTAAPAIDDALLLRLAEAEKNLGSTHRDGRHWQAQLAARVELREQRRDTQHASELARHYLSIDPQPQKALHWARVNWQSAREHADQQLLQQALQLTGRTATDLEGEY